MALKFIKTYSDFVSLGGYKIISPVAFAIYQRLTKNLIFYAKDKDLDALLKDNNLVSRTKISAAAKSLGCDKKTIRKYIKILSFWKVITVISYIDFTDDYSYERAAYILGKKEVSENKVSYRWRVDAFQKEFIESCKSKTGYDDYFSRLRIIEDKLRSRTKKKCDTIIENPIKAVLPGGVPCTIKSNSERVAN